MTSLGNDRWQARFQVEELGGYDYTVEGWVDRFGSWRHELSKKFGAAQDVKSELLEGAALVRDTLQRVPEAASEEHGVLAGTAAVLADETIEQGQAGGGGAGRRGADRDGALHADRSQATRYRHELHVTVERERARFGAWYEMFPRSSGSDPNKSGSFRDAEARLPYIASMGFDVLYLPPIHPIGRAFRKGRNNTLDPGPDDVGSPWAIGGEGGRTRRGRARPRHHRRLRSLRRRRHGGRVSRSRSTSPTRRHPIIRTSTTTRRGSANARMAPSSTRRTRRRNTRTSIRSTSSPRDWEALWIELKRIIEFWIGHGVKIFRVDNPHTKSFRFWEWALGDIKRQHPDTIFLSEAFTRPKVMRYLAKSGFSQSYTYFTWRNAKDELTEYFTELTRTDVREYMRPNLFANTPDILHEYLQHGGRPAFQVRLILAATLGATYGIYSGYELSENVPVKPGSEEYLDSEKYQIRLRDFDDPDEPGRAHQPHQHHPARASRAAARSRAPVSPDRQRPHHLLQQAIARRIRSGAGDRQPRSDAHAARLRAAAARRLGSGRRRHHRSARPDFERALLLARRMELRPARPAVARRPHPACAGAGAAAAGRRAVCRFAGEARQDPKLPTLQHPNHAQLAKSQSASRG